MDSFWDFFILQLQISPNISSLAPWRSRYSSGSCGTGNAQKVIVCEPVWLGVYVALCLPRSTVDVNSQKMLLAIQNANPMFHIEFIIFNLPLLKNDCILDEELITRQKVSFLYTFLRQACMGYCWRLLKLQTHSLSLFMFAILEHLEILRGCGKIKTIWESNKIGLIWGVHFWYQNFTSRKQSNIFSGIAFFKTEFIA